MPSNFALLVSAGLGEVYHIPQVRLLKIGLTLTQFPWLNNMLDLVSSNPFQELDSYHLVDAFCRKTGNKRLLVGQIETAMWVSNNSRPEYG